MTTYPLTDMPVRDELEALGLKSNPKVIRSIVDPTTHGVVIKAVRTGEFREPRAGEWYLSGAIPEAYRTRNDIGTKYHILKLVLLRQTINEEIIKAL